MGLGGLGVDLGAARLSVHLSRLARVGVDLSDGTVGIAGRTAGGADTGDGCGLGSLGCGGDGDDADSLGRGLLAVGVTRTTADSLRNGVDGGNLGVDKLGGGNELGGDLALVAGTLTGAVSNGVDVGVGDDRGVADDGRVGGLGGLGLAGAVGRVRGDDLGGDGADRAVGHAGRARGDGVDLAGGDGRRDGGRSRSGRSRVGRVQVRGVQVGRARQSRKRVGERLGLGGSELVGDDGRGVVEAGGGEGESRLGGGGGSRIAGDGTGRGLGLGRSNRLSRGGRSRRGLGGSGQLRSVGRVRRSALADDIGNRVSTASDGNQVSTAVLVVSQPDVLVVPVVDDVSSSQESITKDGEFYNLLAHFYSRLQSRYSPSSWKAPR